MERNSKETEELERQRDFHRVIEMIRAKQRRENREQATANNNSHNKKRT